MTIAPMPVQRAGAERSSRVSLIGCQWLSSKPRPPRAEGGYNSTIAARPAALIVKVIADLDEDLPRIQIMRSAESEAVIEQHAAIRNVDPVYAHREFLAKRLAERQIKRRVRLQVVVRVRRGIAVREPRTVIDIGRNERLPWQRILPADVQRVSLVVIE